MMKKILSSVMLMMMLMCAAEAGAQWSVTPEAGMNVTKYKDGSPARIGFKGGVAVGYTFGSGVFSLQSGLYYVQRGKGNCHSGHAYGTIMGEDGKKIDSFIDFNSGMVSWSGYGNWVHNESLFPRDMTVEGFRMTEYSERRDYLQLPIMAKFAWNIGKDVRLHVAAGPYLALGIGGKSKNKVVEMFGNWDYEVTQSVSNPFEGNGYRSFDWGATFNVGADIKRFTLGIGYDLGLGKQHKYDDISLKYHTVSFTVGYRF